MKRVLTIAVFLIGIPILSLCIFGLPWLASGVAEMNPVSACLQYPVLIGLYAAAIPFSFALYQALKLLINKDQACSELSAMALKNIKYCAAIISVLYVIGMPFLFLMGHKDDAPGIVALGLFVILASLVSAFFANFYHKRCNR